MVSAWSTPTQWCTMHRRPNSRTTSFRRRTSNPLINPESTHMEKMVMATPSKNPSSVLATGGGKALLDTSDTVFLLLDHQAGLFQTVKDISVAELRANTTMLAKLAALLKIPVI